MFTVFVTTHLPTGKRYLGLHRGDAVADRYYGSGTDLKPLLKADGKKAFSRVVIGYYETKEAARAAERALSLYYNVVADPTWFNRILGGTSGATGPSTHPRKAPGPRPLVTEVTRQRLSEARRKRLTTPETRAKMSATHKARGTRPPQLTTEQLSAARKGTTSSPETRQKISDGLRKAYAEGRRRIA